VQRPFAGFACLGHGPGLPAFVGFENQILRALDETGLDLACSHTVNRITERFVALRRARQKGLVVYLGAGDPDLDATRRLALAFAEAGVDVLELGVPFSDPLADGPVNQLAAQRGLASGTTPGGVLATVRAIRDVSPIPVVLYLYFNLVHRYGSPDFIRDAAAAGVDGLLALDLPPEEEGDYGAQMSSTGLCAIRLIAPTTPDDRMVAIVRHASGFVYCISREGVTGMQERTSAHIPKLVRRIRRFTDLPVAVGFGISNADQVRAVAPHADAVVVGSAVVDLVAKFGREPEMVARVTSFVRLLVEGVRGVRTS
jgi:tryptophan synthase alpha chain